MSDKDIIKISKIKNVRVKNMHNGYVSRAFNIIQVEYRDGEKRIIDVKSRRDLTDIGYYAFMFPEKIKESVIFQEEDIFK